MDKFLSDKRLLSFLIAAFTGVGGWIVTADTWMDLTTTKNFGGLLLILAGVLASNVTSNIFKPAPTITEVTQPASQVTVTTTTTTPPADK
jgi:hypothetical protein